MTSPTKRIFVLAPAALMIVLATGGCAGSMTIALEHDGENRSYELYVPRSYNPQTETPLVLVLHGGGGTGKRMRWTGFNQLAERDAFIVAYPNGLDNSWNDGRTDAPSAAARANKDDVGFLESVIADIGSAYNIDSARVYMTGPSNGAQMTFRFACERSELLAAIAPVMSSMPAQIAGACAPESPVPLLFIHGTEDPLVPYEGGQVMVFGQERGSVLGAEQTLELWAGINGCNQAPTVTELPDTAGDGTTVSLIEYTGCGGNDVLAYRVNGGGHTWPGGLQYLPERRIGITSQELDATEVIWDFFQTHVKP